MTRTFLATLALALTFWLIFLGSLFAVHAFGHVKGCHSRACDRRIAHKRRVHWRHTHPWLYAWHRLSAHERAWARCIANVETRGIPWAEKATVDTHNNYYGAVQFLAATWHAAGGTGLPTQHSLDEQLVRSVRWAHTAGSSQWSSSRTCGAV